MCKIANLSSHALTEKLCRFCQKMPVLGSKLGYQTVKNCQNLEFSPKNCKKNLFKFKLFYEKNTILLNLGCTEKGSYGPLGGSCPKQKKL
jgi:hypothetical protein